MTQMVPAPERVNFLWTRSFWAALAATLTGLAQAGDANFLIPISTILFMLGWIDSAPAFVAAWTPFFSSIGPVITAALGVWAYLERIFGSKQVVLGKAVPDE